MKLHAPQIIWLALFIGGLLLSANKHGKPREGKHNFWIDVVAGSAIAALLWWGGFLR
jgi:hypothetical protein